MKSKILAGLLLAGSSMFAAPRVSFGIGIGAPVVVERPIVAATPCPGPGYVFVNGYWQFRGVGPDWHYDYRRAPERFDRFDRHADHFRR